MLKYKHLKISIHGSTVYKAGSGDIKLKAIINSQSITCKSTHMVWRMNMLIYAYHKYRRRTTNLYLKGDGKVLKQKNFK